MELVEDKHNSDFNIKKYINKTIVINNNSYSEPIIIFDREITNFSIDKPNLININDIEKYLDSITLVLIGTGESTILPNQDLIELMYKKNKGLEFMNTDSACKTHNILLSENRSFVSILYP
jgi:uncharacterized protein|tara:strand:+ start:305 stop:667 length:363 start_codon:yes stop_codon:yes gene_type:complete